MKAIVPLALLLCLAGCPRPQRPNTVVDDPDPREPLDPPHVPTATATVHQECTSPDPAQHPSYTIDVVYDRVDTCVASGARATLIIESSSNPDDQLTIEIDGYTGPGTYTPSTLSVTQGNKLAQTCDDGTVVVSEPLAGQKQFTVSCPGLAYSDTHTCTPALELALRVPCP